MRVSMVLLVVGLGGAAARAQEKAPAKFENFEQAIPGQLVAFQMVAIPAGKVVTPTGSKDGSPQAVELKRFWMGRCEVTWDEYDVFAMALDLPEKGREGERQRLIDTKQRPSLPYVPPDRGYGHEGWPAGSIHVRSAVKYCEWLSQKTGRKYRLPTEQEWEYAAAAGGAVDAKLDKAQLAKVAWFKGIVDEEATVAVGKRAPNAFGLHDVLGNVMEWTVAADGKMVARGGSFVDPASQVGVMSRQVFTPALKDKWQADDPQGEKSVWWLSNGAHVGFRVVCDE